MPENSGKFIQIRETNEIVPPMSETGMKSQPGLGLRN